MFLENLNKELDKFHLLKHPFYQDWHEGKLTLEDLQEYAGQYFHHVEAFPKYLSRLHSKCNDISARRVILRNIMDEEDEQNDGAENHPKLWLDFAEELGCNIEDVKNATMLPKTKALVNGFMDICDHSYAKGLGIYTYERQVPQIAKDKIEGLKNLYGINSEKALKFFKVHIGADEWHSEEFADLIENLNTKEKEIAREGAIEAAKLLWNFLNGIQDQRNLRAINSANNAASAA